MTPVCHLRFKFEFKLELRARALLKFCALNFFLWRHFAKSSDLLFNVFSLFDFMINSFSSKQRLHDLPPAMYAGTHLIIDHLMVNSLPVITIFI